MKNSIVYVSKTEALVTKAFQKRACIFGTEEFKQWREYVALYPAAKMVTKTIKKNPDKKTTRNMTYANMSEFISTLPNSEELFAEFEVIKKRSKVQAHPYGYVQEWFESRVKGFEDFIAKKAAEAEADTSAAA